MFFSDTTIEKSVKFCIDMMSRSCGLDMLQKKDMGDQRLPSRHSLFFENCIAAVLISAMPPRSTTHKDARKSPGCVVHAFAKHVTNRAEAERLYGVNWNTRVINGRVIKCIDARKQSGKRANFQVTARYAITDTVRKDAELNIRSVIEGYAPAGEGIALPPLSEEIINLQPLPRPIPAGAVVLPANVRHALSRPRESTISTTDGSPSSSPSNSPAARAPVARAARASSHSKSRNSCSPSSGSHRNNNCCRLSQCSRHCHCNYHYYTSKWNCGIVF
jgi:hypothetical protein